MITIDLAGGVGSLQRPSNIPVEGLTLSNNKDSLIFYGSVGNELLVYDYTANQLVHCQGEIDGYKTILTVY